MNAQLEHVESKGWTPYKLSNGHHIPGIAFGSSRHPLDKTAGDMDMAIDSGFEHLDTAQMYGNELQVGDGIKLSGLPRDELYITTKWSGLKSIKESANDSLGSLGLDYVDLYLIHNPRLTEKGHQLESWRGLEGVYKQGQTKSIGVSNFGIDELNEILPHAVVKPVVNQIQFNPHVLAESEELLAFHEKHNILTEGYSPLKPLRDGSSPEVVKAVAKITKARGYEPEQVLLSWTRAKGVLPITTSSTKSHIDSYIAAGSLHLTKDEVEAIDKAGKASSARVQRNQRLKLALVPILGVVGLLYLGFQTVVLIKQL